MTNVGFCWSCQSCGALHHFRFHKRSTGGRGEGTDRDSRVQTSDRQTVTLRQTDRHSNKDKETVTDTGTALLVCVCVCVGVYEGICVVFFVCSCFWKVFDGNPSFSNICSGGVLRCISDLHTFIAAGNHVPRGPANCNHGDHLKSLGGNTGRLPFVSKNRFVRMKSQMERFNSVKIFLNKRNTFEGIPLFSFQPKWPG